MNQRKDVIMTELDRALETLHQDIDNPKNQSAFYDLFLNATFFVPTLDEKGAKEAGAEGTDGQVLPLIIEAEGNDYLMLFDSEERLHAWAQEKVKSVAVPGHALAATTEPPLHWALNVGTPYSKQFLPDEIAWLRDVVERCTAEAAKGTEEEG